MSDQPKGRNSYFDKELIEGEDYYINQQGYWVFTEKYHLDRGYCCKNGCQHCPWKYNKDA